MTETYTDRSGTCGSLYSLLGEWYLGEHVLKVMGSPWSHHILIAAFICGCSGTQGEKKAPADNSNIPPATPIEKNTPEENTPAGTTADSPVVDSNPESDCIDKDGDLELSLECGGGDCCDDGTEDELGCSVGTAAEIYSRASEAWKVETIPMAGRRVSSAVSSDGLVHVFATGGEGLLHTTNESNVWAEPKRIARETSGVRTAVGPDGTVYVAYGTNSAFSQSFLRVLKRPPGGVFETILSEGSGHYVWLGVDGAGRAHVLNATRIGRVTPSGFTQWRPDEVTYRVYHPDDGWGVAQSVPGGSDKKTPRFAVSIDGSAFIGMSDTLDPFRIQRYTNEGSDVLVPPNASTLPDAMLAGEQLHLVWSTEQRYDFLQAGVFSTQSLKTMPRGTMTLDSSDQLWRCHAMDGQYVIARLVDGMIEPVQSTEHTGCEVLFDELENPHVFWSKRAPDGEWYVQHARRSPSPNLDRNCDGVD